MIEAGDKYELTHTRFGKAEVEVLDVGKDWFDVRITKGTLVGLMDSWGVGDEKRLRIEHCTFKPKGR